MIKIEQERVCSLEVSKNPDPNESLFTFQERTAVSVQKRCIRLTSFATSSVLRYFAMYGNDQRPIEPPTNRQDSEKPKAALPEAANALAHSKVDSPRFWD